MKYLFVIILLVLVKTSFAGVPHKISLYAEDYFRSECNFVGQFQYDNLTVEKTEDLYEEDKSGYFYRFSRSYNVYYDSQLIGEAFNWGEGAETFGGVEDWDFNINCPL